MNSQNILRVKLENSKAFNVLIILLFLSFIVGYLATLFTYKPLQIGSMLITTALVIFPLRLAFMDIITELYGYKTAKSVVIFLFACFLLMSLLMKLLVMLPSPATWKHGAAFDLILGGSLRVSLAALIGEYIGFMINAYILNRFRTLLHGRYFILRAVGSSIVGDFLSFAIAMPIILYGMDSAKDIFLVTLSNFLFQTLYIIVLSPFLALAISGLKKYMFVNEASYYDFNPFDRS